MQERIEPVEPRLSRDERKQRTRERLIEAAAAVFAQHGYEAASLDQVAEAAGFTKGAVYSNFRSKGDLLLAIIERRIEESMRASLAAIEGLSLEDAFRALEASSTELDPRWLMLMAEFWLHAMRDPEVRAAMAEQYERARRLSAGMIASKYAEAGEEPPMSARDLAIVIEALGVGLGFQAALDPTGVSMGLQGEVLLRLLDPGRVPDAP
ncbi:MAG: TetR/AcrR family transcriptional regulator [Candidatus Limnocylindrales bacterium]